jgi:hypothetical protein
LENLAREFSAFLLTVPPVFVGGGEPFNLRDYGPISSNKQQTAQFWNGTYTYLNSHPATS